MTHLTDEELAEHGRAAVAQVTASVHAPDALRL